MPEFRFTGGDERTFLEPIGLTVAPGDSIEADDNPDPEWFEPVKAKGSRGRKAEAAAPDEEE